MTTAVDFPKDAAEVVRERLRAAFLDTLPDEKLDGMIKAEWNKYFQETEAPSHYRPSKREPSPFQQTVRMELNHLFAKKVQEWIQQNHQELWEWTAEGKYGEGESEMRKAFLEDVLRRISGEVLEALVTGVAKQTIKNMGTDNGY